MTEIPGGGDQNAGQVDANAALAEKPESDQNRYVRRNVIITILTIVVFFAGSIIVSLLLSDEIRIMTKWVSTHLGLGTLTVVLFITDFIVSPVPPDFILWIISVDPEWKSNWYVIIPMFAVLSMCAGHAGYWVCYKFGHTKLSDRLIGRYRERGEALVTRYGLWAVVLGALTPVPFSLTCWIAGLFRLRYLAFTIGCAFRIPRIIGFYLLYHFGFDLGMGEG